MNSENKVDNSLKITLGSSSPYRAQLLQRLQLPFETESPNIDENPLTPQKYGVRGIPTLMMFQDGKLKDTKIGSLPKTTLQAWIEDNS